MKMRILRTIAALVWSAMLIPAACTQDEMKVDPYLKLWYNHPAVKWEEALPLGNGHLGAMVFGTPEMELIQLNDDCFWSGSPYNNNNPEAKAYLRKVQDLIGKKKYKQAQDLVQRNFFAKTAHGAAYQPVGDMRLQFSGHDRYSSYHRELDLNTALQTTTYQVNGISFKREIFASLSHDILAIKVSTDKTGQVNFTMSLNTHQKSKIKVVNGNELVLTAVNPDWEGVPGKLRVNARARLIPAGGQIITGDSTLTLQGASSAVIILSSATNYKSCNDISGDEVSESLTKLKNADSGSFEELFSSHLQKYRSQFNRVHMDLGVTDAVNMPTDERIRVFSEADDPQMISLYYQFGRYLLITSSQSGTQPANLQGIWNKDREPAWDSKYTVNINTEMNYWPAEVSNLTETQRPLIEMMKDLSVTGQSTAKEMYNARGWVVHHNTDLWRITGPVDGFWGMTPSCGAWLCLNIWEPYLFNGKLDYLKEIYPVLRGACEYWLDVLWQEPETGRLLPSPDASPENSPFDGLFTFAGTTMSNQLVFALFNNTVIAASRLNVDKNFVQQLQDAIAKLPPMKIGQHTQLQEWYDDWDRVEDHHRHVSHLLGLYPANLISPVRTPELFEAARNSLEYRGDISTGWSMGWKTCLWARLLDGNRVYRLLKDQISPPGKHTGQSEHSGGTFPNLFCAHPPFQIDGNFGCTAGIAEMFIQSHDGVVFVLPALPADLKSGEVNGLRARGGFEIDLAWKDSKITRLSVRSILGGNLRLQIYKDMMPENLAMELKPALGINPNPFYTVPDVRKPEISEKALLKGLPLKPVYIFDLETRAGKEYNIIP